MEPVGSASLYGGGGSLNLDALSVAPLIGAGGEEEEAEDAAEEQRRQQELRHVLKDAFDDLIEEDDDEDRTLDDTGDPSFHPDQLPTSTPFMADKERSLYDELNGQFDLRRMSEFPTPTAVGVSAEPGDAAAGAANMAHDHLDHGDQLDHYRYTEHAYLAGYHAAELTDGEFAPLRAEETDRGVTEMCDTPRQQLDTSTDISAAHYRHCYNSPHNAAGVSPPPEAENDASSSEEAIEAGLRAQQTVAVPSAWTPAERLTTTNEDIRDPAKYVANKAKDAILARTSRDQLETLYEARGHELSRVRAELDTQRTEAAAELRELRHQATLLQADQHALQTSLQQARSLLVEKESQTTQLTGELNSLKIQLKASENSKNDLTSRLRASEVTVSSLEEQLSALQRSDQLARNQQLHQQLVDGLQQRHAAELASQQQQLTAITQQLETQKEQTVALERRLADSEQQRHRLAADKADVINQLTAGLESAQARCHQLMQTDAAQLRQQLSAEQERRQSLEQQLKTAQERAECLQRDLESCETVLKLGTQDESVAEVVGGGTGTPLAPGQPQHQSTPVTPRSGGAGGDAFSLRAELLRALESGRARRLQVGRLRAELDAARQTIGALTPQLAEKQAQITGFKQQLGETQPAAAAAASAEQLQQLQEQLQTEQDQRKLAEQQLRKIRDEGEKLHKTAEELRRHLAEQVAEADRTRLQAVEDVRAACLQLQDDMVHKLRTEKIHDYETQIADLRDELMVAERELAEVKELYVAVCQEKTQLEADIQIERQSAVAERERAVKTALDQHYDRWSADWKAQQVSAIEKALQTERNRRITQMGTVGCQTDVPAQSTAGAQTCPPTVVQPPPARTVCSQTAAPLTSEQAIQSSDETAASAMDRMKKKLKRSVQDNKKLEVKVHQLEQNLRESACIFETKLKKERTESERRLRELRRRHPSGGVTASSTVAPSSTAAAAVVSAGAPGVTTGTPGSAGSATVESELVRLLRTELQYKTDKLEEVTLQASVEKETKLEELRGTFEEKLRLALTQERLLIAAVDSQRQSADQLQQQVEQLRVQHAEQLQQREQQYSEGLANYQALIDSHVAELVKAEEEMRREAFTSGDLLRTENARLTSENSRLAENYSTAMADRQRDRELYQKQMAELTAQASGSGELRSRISELESRLETADTETADLRTRLSVSRDKLRQYHGYVKQRETHYDSEFRRLEAEYRVAVGKMKEKVMLARERGHSRHVTVTAVGVQTAVTGHELVTALREACQLQRTATQVRSDLLSMLDRCQTATTAAAAVAPAPLTVPEPPEPATYRSHSVGSIDHRRYRPPSRGDAAAAAAAAPASAPPAGPQSVLSAPASTTFSGPQVSPLVANTGDFALASLERIRRDLNYIFPRGGDRLNSEVVQATAAGEELLARLARLPLTPPSRDSDQRS